MEYPVKNIRGKMNKGDKSVFRVIWGTEQNGYAKYVRFNPAVKGSDKQKAAIQKFKETAELVEQVMQDPVARKQYEESFLEQKKYKTLRGYIFAKLYKMND